MVTTKPTFEAHCFCCCSNEDDGTQALYDSIADRSSNIHVFPMENEPSLFSLALCTRTLPDFLTATIIARGFLLSGGEFGGGGEDGYAASSVMRTCVM